MSPIVSVIIPTYKHRDYVLASIGSVFAQTFTDYEVIVVNDGSPDDTKEVLRPLIETGKIRYIDQSNAGQAAARNRGISEAKGEYLALLDDDDLWPADKLAWQVEVLSANPNAVAVYGPAETISGGLYEMGEIASGNVLRRLVDGNFIVSPGQTLLRASAVRAIGGFDRALWGVDDWDLYLRLAIQGPFIYDSRCALRYRLHADNASKDFLRMYRATEKLQAKHRDLMVQVCGGEVMARDACLQVRLNNFRNAWSWAYRYLSAGETRLARRTSLAATRIWPASLLRWTYLHQLAYVCLPQSFRAVQKEVRLCQRKG